MLIKQLQQIRQKKRPRPLKPERDAYQVALNLLARREHSRVELENKLSKKGFPHEQIERALKQLAANDLQSDQRFLEDFRPILRTKNSFYTITFSLFCIKKAIDN